MTARGAAIGVVACACACACGAPVAAPSAAATPGVTIAMYADRDRGGDGGGGDGDGDGDGGSAGAAWPGYAVVDDRRWVEVTGRVLWLDDIDPGAALASLVIEPLAGAPLVLGGCTREQLPVAPPASPDDDPEVAMPAAPYASAIRCAVTGVPGRRLIRALYVSTTLAYRGEHDIALRADDRARVATRFAITTPPWRPRDGAAVRADVALFDGLPGGARPPVELTRGRVAIDGSIAVLALPVRDVAARLRRVYDGAVASDPAVLPTENEWNLGSDEQVWVWLELPGIALSPGVVHVHAELPGEVVRDLVIAAGAAVVDTTGRGATLRMPLWIDDDLHGTRKRVSYAARPGRRGDRVALGVVNLGDTPREVWIEERMRPAHKRVVSHAVPDKPALHGDLLRTRVLVKPGEAQRVSYVVDYAF